MINNQNLNSLVGRMFANAATRQQQQQQDAATSTNSNNNINNSVPAATNIKRNLFGINLNHDQLKQDLKEMWQEQLDRKKREWNFDFETLKPIDPKRAATTHTNNKNSNDLLSSQAQPRFEWNKIKTVNSSQHHQSNDFVLTSFNSNESSYSSDTTSSDDEDEEYDEALVMPAFYKYQRRQKMNSGFKFIQIESQTQPKREQPINGSSQTGIKHSAFSKLKQSSNSTSSYQKSNSTLHRPKAVRSAASHGKQQTSRQQNLIITFSENRKDTLRSAVGASASSTHTPTTMTKTNENKAIKRGARSAFKQPVSHTVETTPMKQQSLLDMLKQRKRKTPAIGTCSLTKQAANSVSNGSSSNQEAVSSQMITTAHSIVHNLRPRTVSFN